MDLTEATDVLKGLDVQGLSSLLGEVGAERVLQHMKWGVQNWENGTGHNAWKTRANSAKDTIRWIQAHNQSITFQDILHEEVCEAFAETDPVALRKELIQVAAVCVQWIQAIDRKAVKPS